MKQIKNQTVAKPAIILLIISALLLLLPACRNNNNPPETTDDTQFTDTDKSSDIDPSETSAPDTDKSQATIVFKKDSDCRRKERRKGDNKRISSLPRNKN